MAQITKNKKKAVKTDFKYFSIVKKKIDKAFKFSYLA